jgi:transposase
MISEISNKQVYLACGSTDLRKSIDGLAVLVKEAFDLDPFSQCLFVFCNRNRDKPQDFAVGAQWILAAL